MSFLDHFRSLRRPEHRLAWAVAITADALQIVAFPLFSEGGASPADSALDLIVAFLMIRLLGWHWAFLPTLATELIPGADLFPTWTAAVWFVTRQQLKANSGVGYEVYSEAQSETPHVPIEPEILPPGPAPERRR